VKDPRVRTFLEERVRAGGSEALESAMAALAVWHGMPERVAGAFMDVDSERTGSAAFVEALKLLLDGDAVGAALLLVKGEEFELGAVRDPRAVAALGALRSDRRHYWEATAGLVLAGDKDARRELAGLFLDGRTWIFYPVQDGRVFTFGMDPEWIDFWVHRIDATCCIGFSALESFGQLFPLLCTRGVGRRTGVQDLIERWWRKNRDHPCRTDSMVKLAGNRVYPAEVANQLAALPGVRDAEVVTGRTGDGEPALAAFVVLDGTEAVPALRGRLARRVPGYMMPRWIVLRESLPRLGNGKPDLRRLRDEIPEYGTDP
jgi:hypothetical protein